MKGRRIITPVRVVTLLLFAGAFACGEMEPKPEPNRTPVAVGAIPPLSLVEGQSESVDVSAFFSDPDGDELTYTATSTDPAVLSVSISGSILTAEALSPGSVQVTVTATDPDGASAAHVIDVTVEAANQDPVAVGAIPPQTLTEGDTVTIDASGFFSDPDGDALTYAAASSDAGVATASVDGSMVMVVAVAEGTATVTVTASDPDGASAMQEAMVTVEAANRAPVAVGEIPDLELAEGQDPFVSPIDLFFMDPDGDTLTYAAESSDTAVVTVSMAANIITVVAVSAGEAMVTITATDPGGLSATQTATVTVTAVNRAPELTDTIPHQTLAPGDTLTLDVSNTFTDPDGDTLTFTVMSDDTTVATVSVDGAMVTIVAVDVGSAFITVTATDPGELSASQAFAATVATGNLAPETVGEIAAQTLKVGATATLDVSGYFNDPNGDSLAYEASSSDDAVAGVTIDGETVTITGAAEGTATLTVTASDPDSLSAIQEAEIAVVPNQSPEVSDTIPVHDLFIVLDSMDNTMVDTLTMVVLDMAAYFDDPDGDELTYTASTSDEAIAKVDSVEGSVVTTIAVSSDSTFAHDTTMLTVTATDPDGESATQTATVLVANGPYVPWEGIEILEDGRVRLAALGIALTGCFPVNGSVPIAGQIIVAHWTAWQVKKDPSTGWLMIPGTYTELEACWYPGLATAPAGTYRLVGEVSTRPLDSDPEDFVRSRQKSENEIVRKDN